MTKIWNTKITDYLPFPWACEHCSMQNTTEDAYLNDDGESEYAVQCDMKPYRILESECLGMECSDCKMRSIKDYERMINHD